MFLENQKVDMQSLGQKHPNSQICKFLCFEGSKDSQIYHDLFKELAYLMVINFTKRISHLLGQKKKNHIKTSNT